jgi:hypothetical protein
LFVNPEEIHPHPSLQFGLSLFFEGPKIAVMPWRSIFPSLSAGPGYVLNACSDMVQFQGFHFQSSEFGLDVAQFQEFHFQTLEVCSVPLLLKFGGVTVFFPPFCVR